MHRSHLTALLFTFVAACGASSPQVGIAQPGSNAGEVGEEQDESTNDLADHDLHHHHGGIAMFVATSLDTLGVEPEQNDRVQKIQEQLVAEMKPAHDAEREVLLALADGLAAGQFDQPRLDAAIEQTRQTAAQVHDAVADTMNELYKTLTPPQRQAIADKLQAHFDVWTHMNGRDAEGSEGPHAGHVGVLGKALDLTPDQVKTIRANFRDALAKVSDYNHEDAAARIKAFAEAFASDHFDAHALQGDADANREMARWGIQRTMTLYTSAAPVLTPEQRQKAADQLRHHADYKPSEAN
jgi:Spy/CpxP family protein refolding chaperone